MRLALTLIILTSLSVPRAASQPDPLEAIKATMVRSGCCWFEFISILESDVFDSVDTTLGSALIATDGRYRLTLGPDEYLRTEEYLYSLAGEQNQVTVEKTDSALDESISFITRLDEYYHTQVMASGRTYRLIRFDSTAAQLPDSLMIFLTGSPSQLEQLEYFDQNDDLNRIVFQSQEYRSECDGEAFLPQFPDSTEFIKLY